MNFAAATKDAIMHDVDGLNAGYARLLLDEYLENPEAVPAEWRALFESGEAAVLRTLPGIGLPAGPSDGNGARASNGDGPRGAVAEAAPAAEPLPPATAPPVPLDHPVVAAPDPELLGGVAAAMALVKAYRMHGHLA